MGRFEFNDGSELVPKNATLATLKRDRVSQRLIGSFGWSDVGRSFDGLRYSYSKPANDFTFVAAIPTRGVFQTDGWGWNRAAFGYASFTHEWGHGNHAADTRVFMLDYDDWRHILKTDNRPVAIRRNDTENIRIETFGAHSLHAFTTAAGTIDALAWGAVQTGRWGTQTQLAYALSFEGGFQPKMLPGERWLKPWFRGGFTIGSGDGNPNDTRHGTFFQVLPTPRPYARFPFFNMMNTEDRFGALVLRPHAKITVSSEFHALRLSNANDLWYSGGGVFQPWTFGYAGRATSGRRSLGNLYDTSVEYRATRRVTFTGYFGYAQGLATMEQVYPAGKTGVRIHGGDVPLLIFTMGKKERLIVIGNGMAGARFVEDLVARRGRDRFDIVVLGDDPYGNYNRILLSNVVAGVNEPKDIFLNPSEWYERNGISLRAGVRVHKVDRAKKCLCCRRIDEPYDQLVFATGSRPFVPPIDRIKDDTGGFKDGVFLFRTLDDSLRIIDHAVKTRKAVVLGGGLLGLEAARGLLNRGLDVHVVELASHPMAVQLDASAGAILRATLEKLGIRFHLGKSVVRVNGAHSVESVTLDDGHVESCEMFVISAGIRPNSEIARDAGLTVDRAIVVGDDLACVNDPAVSAIGECAQHRGQVYGLVAPCREQAKVLAMRLSGADPQPFSG